MQRLWYHLQYIPAHSREDSVVSLFVPRRLLLRLNGLLVDDFSPLPVSSGVVGTSGVKDHYDARAISLSRLSGTESTPSLWLKSCISEPQLQEVIDFWLIFMSGRCSVSLSFCLGIFTGSLWHLCNTQRFIQHSFRMDGLMQAVIKLLQTQSTNFFFSLLSLSACGWLLYPVDGVASCHSQHRESHYFKHLIMLLQQSSSSYTRIAAISQPYS